MTHPATNDDPLLTFREVMQRLRIGRSTVYRLKDSGKLPGHKVGTQWRFFRSDVERQIERQGATVPG